MDMRSKQPTFTVEEYKPTRNTEKKTYGKLTYETMAKFIANYETDEKNRKAMLAEFDTVQKISKTQKGAYIFVKKWFLGKYKEVLMPGRRSRTTRSGQKRKPTCSIRSNKNLSS